MKMRFTNVKSAGKTRPWTPQGKGLAFGLLCAFLFLGLFVSTAAAETEWKITPENPVVGDTLRVRGTASPEEELRAEISFEMELPVSEEGRYEYLLEEIKVPEGKNNRFTVRAEEVKNLNVSVNKFIWVNLTSEAGEDGVATISQGHVPPFTYLIFLGGEALNVPDEENSSVNLTVTAAQTLKADSKGKFKFDYNTNSLPAGLYTIRIGDTEKIIELKPEMPNAAFSASPTLGEVPLAVQFFDRSTGLPTSWKWKFGDGKTSTLEDPKHTYCKAGKYHVSLTVSNAGGNDTLTKCSYITVNSTA